MLYVLGLSLGGSWPRSHTTSVGFVSKGWGVRLGGFGPLTGPYPRDERPGSFGGTQTRPRTKFGVSGLGFRM